MKTNETVSGTIKRLDAAVSETKEILRAFEYGVPIPAEPNREKDINYFMESVRAWTLITNGEFQYFPLAEFNSVFEKYFGTGAK